MTDSFDIIVADPPWKFASNSVAKPGRNAMRHYECMTDAELAALTLPAAKDALLFMWTTVPMLARAMPLLGAWGFTYKSQLVWVKHRVGTGFWVRNRHELILVARRGKFPCPRPAPFGDSVIASPAREHSRKPPDLMDRIDKIWPNARKLEMFAREPRRGWTAHGDETTKFTTGDAT